ncbi:hypothetical protein MetMK1DRAFT_00023210 [Metallosphaera yellowstonensis MK1]|uniref:Uncharacterized protein n=2 Tax=Metallosphaera TaxID=41980 RepID=H2C6X6_9CREN|nr:hypothetical protein MetMK1DRAFT_00023210 [Metallosphaera yellowstonensis MK1]
MRDLYVTLLLITTMLLGGASYTFHYHLNSLNEDVCLKVTIEPSVNVSVYNLSDGIAINFQNTLKNVTTGLEYEVLNSTSLFFPLFQFKPNSTYHAVIETKYDQFEVIISVERIEEGSLTLGQDRTQLNQGTGYLVYLFGLMVVSIILSFFLKKYKKEYF